MSKIVLQQRDNEIISFLKKEFYIADTDTLASLFFNNSIQMCSKRLKKLCDSGYLHKWRSSVTEKYLYYKNSRPKNYKHNLMVVQCYAMIKQNAQIIKMYREYEIRYRNTILIADMLIVIKDNKGRVVPLIVECECGTKYYNNKWTQYIKNKYYTQKFPIEPIVVVCYKGDRIPKSSIDIITHKLS